MNQPAISDLSEWSGPGVRVRSWRQFRLSRFLLRLVIPPKGQKVVPTKAGVILILLALGIGVAAYNTSSSILFITLSLLLSTIIVSGLLSWSNFNGTAWRVSFQPPFRAGQKSLAVLEVFNGKKHLPTYSLAFDFKISSGDAGRLPLRRRLDPGESRRLEWTFRPRRRGRELVEMTGVGSQFPFGFLYKHFGGRVAREVYVWPVRVSYEADLRAISAPESHGDVLSQVGAGTDFVNLRRYAPGDSHRHIHWKASARQRRLMVRQMRAESHSGFFIHVETPASIWRRPEQFEQLCSLAASLAEDLFRQGQLVGVIVNDGAPFQIRRMADLELFLDQLAVLEPLENYAGARTVPKRNVIRFEPGFPEGVHAYIRGQKAATA
jgi:uncharacterized protein (DUF58 family)